MVEHTAADDHHKQPQSSTSASLLSLADRNGATTRLVVRPQGGPRSASGAPRLTPRTDRPSKTRWRRARGGPCPAVERTAAGALDYGEPDELGQRCWIDRQRSAWPRYARSKAGVSDTLSTTDPGPLSDHLARQVRASMQEWPGGAGSIGLRAILGNRAKRGRSAVSAAQIDTPVIGPALRQTVAASADGQRRPVRCGEEGCACD